MTAKNNHKIFQLDKFYKLITQYADHHHFLSTILATAHHRGEIQLP